MAADAPPAGVPFDLIHARLVPVHVAERDRALRTMVGALRRGFRELLRQRGADLAYGRKLPRLLREAGVVDVEADACFPVTSPACAAGGLDLATSPMISAWGRRPVV